ncbi:hypothetical protein BKA65DRAFT_1242 [Rhexocercosporidium sp. MPI-PUGE-AT-0058]|nr:hypothetical protein BKA65DRAFT_1242 [Rhexocercosporidium sp. MPI-PUGE-AT-0058]
MSVSKYLFWSLGRALIHFASPLSGSSSSSSPSHDSGTRGRRLLAVLRCLHQQRHIFPGSPERATCIDGLSASRSPKTALLSLSLSLSLSPSISTLPRPAPAAGPVRNRWNSRAWPCVHVLPSTPVSPLLNQLLGPWSSQSQAKPTCKAGLQAK